MSGRGTGVVAVVGVLVVAGGAYAYFTSTGSGSGSATVGSSSRFTVTVGTPSGGPLYPGSGTQTFSYTVTNAGTGHQALTATAAVVASVPSGVNAGAVTHNGTAVPGCLASWFTATDTAPTPLPQDLAGGASSSAGSVELTMSNVHASRDACQGAAPDVTVSAS